MSLIVKEGDFSFDTNDYLDTFFVMHFIGVLPSVGISINHLPQAHVTFLGQAHSDSEIKSYKFVSEVQKLPASLKPFLLEAGEFKFFGKDANIPVLELIHTAEVQNLHETLLEAHEKHGLVLSQPDFAGKFFKPHSSLIENAPILGNSIYVDSFTVVRHIGGYGSGVVEVIAHFLL